MPTKEQKREYSRRWAEKNADKVKEIKKRSHLKRKGSKQL
jgi:hypothetical protein